MLGTDASLLCARLLGLKVSRCLELPKPEAHSQEGNEFFTTTKRPLQSWSENLPRLPRGDGPLTLSKEQNSQLTSFEHPNVQ